MARKVFFSYHYERDTWRVNQVRNSWVTKGSFQEAGYIDKAEFEKLKLRGEQAVKKWIDEQLEGTSVTVVLIGAETYQRKWVRYEILKSFDRGNALLAIRIHNLKDEEGKTDKVGENPFHYVGVEYSSNELVYAELSTNGVKKFDLLQNPSIRFPDIVKLLLSIEKFIPISKFYNYLYDVDIPIYDWKVNYGYDNIGQWVENAASAVGK